MSRFSPAPPISFNCHMAAVIWKNLKPEVDKVDVEIYYESLCGGCEYLITKTLVPTYKKLKDIMNLTFVVYGNAFDVKLPSGEIQIRCQHGPAECIGNLVENCGLHYIEDIESKVDFINCMETSTEPQKYGQKCASQVGKSEIWPKVEACMHSKLGHELILKAQAKTFALKPSHQYVPWTLVNGVHQTKYDKSTVSTMVQYVCDEYKGPKPELCK
ncbi:Gamma-interferon-inducible lysosomal thiol reductase [Nymphon striatum]|nr:Gamma-interferon-inducible lysosomal thiol reductase [Nymphon striatum]